MSPRDRRNLAVGLAFLAPNVLGFLAFTLVPLVLSLVLAFSNWDLKLHNIFRQERIKFIGFDNFARLVSQPDFWRFLGNTQFLMIGIPFSIAGSLCLALLLSRDLRGGGGGGGGGGGSRRVLGWVVGGGVLLAAVGTLAALGFGGTGMAVLLGGVGCTILLAGTVGGSTVYRTLFYLPSFTAGVATILLWKNLYNPNYGPINQFLAPALDGLGSAVRAAPAGLFAAAAWLAILSIAPLALAGFVRIRRSWADGDSGSGAALLGVSLLLLPMGLATVWSPSAPMAVAMLVLALALLTPQAIATARGRNFTTRAGEGAGGAILLGAALACAQLVLLGASIVLHDLPAMAAGGLKPPGWHTSYAWAKPALMVMAFWSAVGSNNMLLYLAGLSGIPAELYEAADIDGGSRIQKFWHVTWPQLAPTTFFIVVMSVIGGLQGGFEMARAMTKGGPDGATTTLSYSIYMEGFEAGRLGYSSAIAWALFVLVLLVTLFNWRFGSRYASD